MSIERVGIIYYANKLTATALNTLQEGINTIFLDKKTYHDFLKDTSSSLPITVKNKIHPLENYRKFLGTQNSSVLIQFDNLNLNYLLSIAGTIKQNGLILIVITGQLSLPFLSYLHKIALIFKLKFFDLRASTHSDDVDVIHSYIDNWSKAQKTQVSLSINNKLPSLSNKQLFIFNALLTKSISENNFTALLCGNRGTGKTTTIIHLINSLLQLRKCKITLLDGGEGNIANIYQGLDIKIITPQNFALYADDTDLLIIEEAATISLKLLNAIIQKYKKIIISSTILGYEGTSQGINLKLETKSPITKYQLTENFRYANDNFENFLNLLTFNFKSSLLDAITEKFLPENQESLALKDNIFSYNISDNLVINVFNFPNILLIFPEKYLQQLGSINNLLIANHYQTSSQDIIRWLNDKNAFLFTLTQTNIVNNIPQNKIIALCITSVEAITDDFLKEKIFNGLSRPKANLLPQTLLAHAGFNFEQHISFIRIQRIVTDPHYQRKHLASELIKLFDNTALQEFIHKNSSYHTYYEKPSNIISGVSFALIEKTYKFWEYNKYLPVNISLTKDNASGEYSLLMVKAHSELYTHITHHWSNFFISFKAPIILNRHNMLKESIILNISRQLSSEEIIQNLIFTEKLTKHEFFAHNFIKVINSIAYFNHSIEHGIVEIMVFTQLFSEELNELSFTSKEFSNMYQLLRDYIKTYNLTLLVKQYKLANVKEVGNKIRTVLRNTLEHLSINAIYYTK